MRMGCVASSPEAKHSKEIGTYLHDEGKRIRNEIKILLLGPGESGKSTIFKQMKILQADGGYTTDELLEYKYIVFGNCVAQMKVLVENLQKLNIEIADPANRVRVERMQAIPSGGDSWSATVAADIKALWADKGIKDVFSLRDRHYQLNDSAQYFFDNIDRVNMNNYIPSQDDVLRARIRTTGIQEAEFKFEDIEFRMLDVGGQRSERRKWIHCFDSVTAVMFCVSLSEYDQTLREDGNQNRMKESLLLFDEVYNSHWFKNVSFILFLNKMDLFREKIQRVDLAVCFPKYKDGCNFEKGSAYIKERFMEHRAQNNEGGKIYPHFTCAISTENIDFVFRSVRDTVLKTFLKEIIPVY